MYPLSCKNKLLNKLNSLIVFTQKVAEATRQTCGRGYPIVLILNYYLLKKHLLR